MISRPAAHSNRKHTAVIATAAVLAMAFVTPAQALDPLVFYGSSLDFEIRRDGQPVGTHSVSFTPGPDDTVTVVARSSIAVRFLVFTAYRFTYESRSVWRNGQVEALTVRTDDDGTISRVTGSLNGDRLVAEGPRGTVDTPATTFPTDHWHPGVRGASVVLNTITGGLNRVTMTREGVEPVPTGDGPRPAERWRYSGELDTTVWYDHAGRWVGLRFAASDGSVIDYVCRRCGTDQTAGAPGP